MLSSIHPLGERSRNNSYALTATSHAIGGSIGGALLGLLMGSAAFLSTVLVASDHRFRLVLLAIVISVASVIERINAEGILPSRRHQVDETWIQKFRGWVYGSGFGFELGFGLSTIITTGFVHLLLVVMVLSGSWATSVAIGAVFGAVRTALVFTTRSVHSPDDLRSLLRRVDDWSARSRTISVMIATALAAVSLVMGLS